jgi:hypothetical protein
VPWRWPVGTALRSNVFSGFSKLNPRPNHLMHVFSKYTYLTESSIMIIPSGLDSNCVQTKLERNTCYRMWRSCGATITREGAAPETREGRRIRPREACRITLIFHGLLVLIFIALAFICYINKKIYESSFQRNKTCIFWTSEPGVMTLLVEAAQAVLWLQEKPRTLQFLHQYDFPLAVFMLMFTPN